MSSSDEDEAMSMPNADDFFALMDECDEALVDPTESLATLEVPEEECTATEVAPSNDDEAFDFHLGGSTTDLDHWMTRKPQHRFSPRSHAMRSFRAWQDFETALQLETTPQGNVASLLQLSVQEGVASVADGTDLVTTHNP